jgi:hypothetical protein
VNNAIEKAVNDAFGVVVEQEMGRPPAWSTARLPPLTGEPLDSAMLGVAVIAALESVAGSFVARESYFAEAERLERSVTDAEDSILELSRLGWLHAYNWHAAGRIARQYCATRQGIHQWLSATDPSYEERLRVVGASFINDGYRHNSEIQEETGYSLSFVNHCFEELDARGLIEVRRVAAGGLRTAKPTASLRRWLKQSCQDRRPGGSPNA